MKKIIRINSLSFVMFYITAALFYPDFFNPLKLFFCDLMQIQSETHKSLNFGRPFALLSLISISCVIATFFIWFSNQTQWSKPKKLFTKISGSAAAFFTVFLFTSLHDELILIASIVGAFPISLVGLELLKMKKKCAPVLGCSALFLLTFYNLSFYLNLFELLWPTIQKISIFLCLLWINIFISKQKNYIPLTKQDKYRFKTLRKRKAYAS